MNENARKWVEALRSGEYQQGHSLLRSSENKMCCLGVACEINPNAEFMPGNDDREGGYLIGYGPLMVSLMMDGVMREWLGMASPDGGFDGGSLALLNDQGKTFSDIADVIESEPEGLFT